MADVDSLRLDYRPPLALLNLARAERGNRLDRETVEALRRTLEELADDSVTRAVVLTGAAGIFSEGWDATLLDEPLPAVGGVERFGAVFQFIAASPLPVLAAIDGLCVSAGFELALACDIRLASTRASFGFPESASGRLPQGGGTQRLARIAGRAAALELILSGEPIDAAAALARGIVSAVVAPEALPDAALRLATVIASRGPIALAMAKEAVHHGTEMPLEQALRLETDLTVLLQTTHDRAEGVQSFTEKRAPRFEGR